MKVICPYCEKLAKKSYGYKDMMVCVNPGCSFYLKDDVRNLDEEINPGNFDLIVGLKTPKEKRGFVVVSLTESLLLEAMEKKDELEAKGIKRASIRIKEDEAEFFTYTQKTAEMTDAIIRKKYEEVRNLKVRNWKRNEKVEVISVHIVVSEEGIRIQAKNADTYSNYRSFLIPWDFF